MRVTFKDGSVVEYPMANSSRVAGKDVLILKTDMVSGVELETVAELPGREVEMVVEL